MLTPEELAAIAAFPAEKIKVIPRGVSGIDIEAGPPRLTRATKAKWEKSRKIDDTIRFLVSQGLKDKEIAQSMKLALHNVKARKMKMGLTK